MKTKLNFLLIVIGIVSLTFTSCSKDDDSEEPVQQKPSITFLGGTEYISQDATLTVGQEFMVGITANENADSKKNISTFKVVRTFNNVNTTVYEEDGIGNPTYSWESAVNANAEVGQERWTFTVTDNAGESNEIAFIITTEAMGDNVVSYASVDMGSYDDTDYGSFFATSTGLAYKKPAASADPSIIDFAFFYGASNGITFGAPANTSIIDVYDLTWSPLNATLFQFAPISSADFDAIGSVYEFPEFTGTETIVNHLGSGDVVYFKTVTNKLGFIRINNSTKNGFEINIDVKVME